MSNEVQVAVVGLFGMVMVALIGAVANLFKERGAQREMYGEMRMQLNTLWEIYGIDAIKAARNFNLVQEKSPLTIAPGWEKIVPLELRRSIERSVAKKLDGFSPKEIARAVLQEHMSELQVVSIEQDVSVQALMGALQVFVADALKEAIIGPPRSKGGA